MIFIKTKHKIPKKIVKLKFEKSFPKKYVLVLDIIPILDIIFGSIIDEKNGISKEKANKFKNKKINDKNKEKKIFFFIRSDKKFKSFW